MDDRIAAARTALRDSVRTAYSKFRTDHAGEKIYAFALYNDDDGVALDGAANTEEALASRLSEGDQDETYVRWTTAEWPYEGGFLLADVYEMLAEPADNDDDDQEEDYDLLRGTTFAVMVLALADLDQEGFFATGADRQGLTLFCTLSDSEHTGWLERESAKRLNPPAVFKKLKHLIDDDELRDAREEHETYQVFLKVLKKHGTVAQKPAAPAEKSTALSGSAQRFELAEGKSNKFWEIAIAGPAVTVRFGRIGTQGQTQTKEFGDETQAATHAAKLIKEKLAKGYLEVKG